MTGFFVAIVRAPITGAVLITEMAGSFAHFRPLSSFP
jgi:H+/Cl- antiporter ClcA